MTTVPNLATNSVRKARAERLLADYGALIALAVLFAINVCTRGANFLQVENLRNMVSQNAGVGIIAIGMTLVIAAGGIDLSVGSLTAVCGAVAILIVNRLSGGNPTVTILLAGGGAVVVGLVAGLFNGIVIAYGRVAAFVVTLAGLAGFRSIALVLGNGGEIRSQLPALQNFGLGGVAIPLAKDANGGPVLLYWSAIAFLLIVAVADFVLKRTVVGRHIQAVGQNPKATLYSGVNVRKVRLGVYVILGGLVGLASLLVGARMNSVGTGSVGLNYELDAIAAVVIGGTSLRGGRGRAWGTFVGVMLLTLISNMIPAYHVDTNWQGLVRGAVILIAVLLQRGKKEDE